jgi:hypothetical protein
MPIFTCRQTTGSVSSVSEFKDNGIAEGIPSALGHGEVIPLFEISSEYAIYKRNITKAIISKDNSTPVSDALYINAADYFSDVKTPITNALIGFDIPNISEPNKASARLSAMERSPASGSERRWRPMVQMPYAVSWVNQRSRGLKERPV